MAPPKKLKSLEGIRADKDFDWKAFGEEVALNPERAAFAKKFGHKGPDGAASEGYDYFHGNWGRWIRDKNRWDPNRWRRHQNFFKAAWDLWKPPADVTDPDVEGDGSGGDDGGVDGGVDDGTPDTFTPNYNIGEFDGVEMEYDDAYQQFVDFNETMYGGGDEDEGIIGGDDGSTPIDDTDPIDNTDPIGDTDPVGGTPAEEAIRQFTATHMRQDPNINPYR